MTESKELMIREEELDWLNIINLAFNRKNWGKTYTLYRCGNATIYTQMYKFNFRKSVATFVLELEYFYKNKKHNRSTYIDYVLRSFTPEDFKMHLRKRIITMLSSEIKWRKRCKAESKHRHLYCPTRKITHDIIRKQGYGDDLDAIGKIPTESIVVQAYEELVDQVHREMNEAYHSRVRDEIDMMELHIDGVSALLSRLKECDQ